MANFYSAVQNPYFPPKLQDIVKLGVKLDYEMTRYLDNLQLDPSKPTEFFKFQQKESLSKNVEDLCASWQIKEAPENFALQLTTKDQLQQPYHYVTEANRSELKNGEVLLFTLSPKTLCAILLQRLKQLDSNEEVLESILQKLSSVSTDPAVAQELIDQGGLGDVVALIEKGQFANLPTSSAYLLTTFWQLMDGCQRSWDDVTEKLIHEVALTVTGVSKSSVKECLSVALAIIEAIATTSSHFAIIEKKVPVANLVILLFSSDHQVQHNTLAVMNALFAKADFSGKELMFQLFQSKAVRGPIVTNVLRQKATVGAELAHQLHVLQQNLLNMYDVRAKRKICQNSADKLLDLRRAAFDATGEAFSPTSSRKNPSAHAREFKKLGFRNPQNPFEDFEQTPPGALALDCMLFFAEKHKPAFAKIILDNSCRTDHRECPFVQTSVCLVKVLLEICNVGQPPVEEGQTYYEVFFNAEHPFEELFSLAIILLNKTWKEMKASVTDDMSKVLAVVKEQIVRSMQKKPDSFKTLENETKNYNYSEILKLWDQEQLEKEESEFNTPPIIELKKLLKPQIENLVKANRYCALKTGQEFAKYTRGQKGAREKGKFWYWKLAPNEKCILYADCLQQDPPKMDDMKNSLDLEDVLEIRMGNECPHVKELKTKNKTSNNECAFSIMLRDSNMDDCFNFVAPDVNTFTTWIDGLYVAIGKKMPSKNAAQECEMLLNLDVKLRLLDLEDVQLPNFPPPVPPLPCLDGLFT